MIDIGMTSAENARLDRLLAAPHQIKVGVHVMSLDGDYKQDLSYALQAGQVTVDATADVSRSLDISFTDPLKRIQLDPDDPSKQSVFIADMLKVVYHVIDPNSDDRFTIPIFKGPIDTVVRSDTTIQVTAQGKESLSLNNAYMGRTFKAGQYKTDVIQHILADLCGETQLEIPDLTFKLPNDLKITHNSIPWKVAKRLASSMGRQLFYDGRGVCRMRDSSGAKNKPVFTINDRWITAEPPQISYDMTTVLNTVIVKGAKPKKAKTNVTYTAVAPKDHPLSPWRLGRGGVPRYIFTVIENSALRSVEECRKVAEERLNKHLRAGISVQWNGLIHPRLEPEDLVHINTDTVNATIALDQFTIPLTVTPATFGYLKRVRPRGGVPPIRVKRTR